jgi:hypothetical protein
MYPWKLVKDLIIKNKMMTSTVISVILVNKVFLTETQFVDEEVLLQLFCDKSPNV